MKRIEEHEIHARLARDNPWWAPATTPIAEASQPRRVYFEPFKALALNFAVPRATVLLGPRRVGKTFMIKQLVHEAIASGIAADSILYASVDTPLYSGVPLEKLLRAMPARDPAGRRLVVFDEIQYLANWESHLKDLVDNHPGTKFVASGSAAAALRLKSKESGAGRFSDFMLPPLTFYEFLVFMRQDAALIRPPAEPVAASGWYETPDIAALNRAFVDYLNFGGYPEAVLRAEIRDDPDRFIRNDIIDKVLLKDLPSLYGISDIKELNHLFSTLAYNAGMEINLEAVAQSSGLAKPTIKKYVEYLESAFLVMKLSTVDDHGRSMKRERNFKIYLNNPSMRAFLFAPVAQGDEAQIGHLAESAIFSQWQHAPDYRNLRYARWRNEGEVDAVYLDSATQKPLWIGEIKWSDRVAQRFEEETRSVRALLHRHKSVESAFFTTRTYRGRHTIDGRPVEFVPSALYCYTVGRNVARRLATLAR